MGYGDIAHFLFCLFPFLRRSASEKDKARKETKREQEIHESRHFVGELSGKSFNPFNHGSDKPSGNFAISNASPTIDLQRIEHKYCKLTLVMLEFHFFKTSL